MIRNMYTRSTTTVYRITRINVTHILTFIAFIGCTVLHVRLTT